MLKLPVHGMIWALALGGCQPKVACGAGTHLEGDACVADDADTDTDTDTDTGSRSYTVCDDGVAPYTTLQDAVDAASDGDTPS